MLCLDIFFAAINSMFKIKFIKWFWVLIRFAVFYHAPSAAELISTKVQEMISCNFASFVFFTRALFLRLCWSIVHWHACLNLI